MTTFVNSLFETFAPAYLSGQYQLKIVSEKLHHASIALIVSSIALALIGTFLLLSPYPAPFIGAALIIASTLPLFAGYNFTHISKNLATFSNNLVQDNAFDGLGPANKQALYSQLSKGTFCFNLIINPLVNFLAPQLEII